MALSSCTDLHPEEKDWLLRLARESIRDELVPGSAVAAPLPDVCRALHEQRAVFVTLKRQGRLRGCIGSLEATLRLPEAVVEASVSAALRDPRFPPLAAAELDEVSIEISVLSAMQPIDVDSHEALLASLRPGKDGLLLEDGARRATFLPQVWAQLPDAEQFLAQLLAKAGLPPGHWSPGLHCYRYEAAAMVEVRPAEFSG